jgi:CelD/BcsL family acetyltransferase involved in cellulose biosynthesis
MASNDGHWVYLNARNSFPRYVEEWDRLNADTTGAHPLLDGRFVAPLVRHFADARDLLVFRHQGAGLGAMLLLTPRGYGRWQTFSPSQAPVAPVLFSDPSVMDDMLASAPGPAFMLDVLFQDPKISPLLNQDDPRSFELMSAAKTMSIDLAQDFSVYWDTRSDNLRRNIRRRLKFLSRDGLRAELRIARDRKNLPEAIARYGVLESKGWKGRIGTAVHPSNAQGRFYEEVLLNFSDEAHASVFELHIGETLAAAQLMIGTTKMLVTLKSTYNESLAEYAPGRLLDYMTLEHLCPRPFACELEYYTNASSDQLSWSTGNRTINHITIYRPKWLHRVMDLARTARTTMIERSRTPDSAC